MTPRLSSVATFLLVYSMAVNFFSWTSSCEQNNYMIFQDLNVIVAFTVAAK